LLKNAFAATARSKSLIVGVLSITSITIGVILLVEGLFLIILDASLPLRAGEANYRRSERDAEERERS